MATATRQEGLAVLGKYNGQIAKVNAIWRSDRRGAKNALQSDEFCPVKLRDYTCHYLNRLANHVPIESGPRDRPENLELIAAASTTDGRLTWIDWDGQLWLWIREEIKDPQHLVDAGKAKFLTFSSDGQLLFWSRGDGEVEFFLTPQFSKQAESQRMHP